MKKFLGKNEKTIAVVYRFKSELGKIRGRVFEVRRG